MLQEIQEERKRLLAAGDGRAAAAFASAESTVAEYLAAAEAPVLIVTQDVCFNAPSRALPLPVYL